MNTPGLLHVMPLLALLAAGPAPAAGDLPPPTAAERAAAFPAIGGHGMAGHMNDDPFLWKLALDELEWQDVDGGGLGWDVEGWAGRDDSRAVLRAEGRRADGDTVDSRLELLYWRPLAAWWNGVGGIRHDTGLGPDRTYGALGVEGVLPGQVGLELTGYLGEGGQSGASVKAGLPVLLTNRLVLLPQLEAEAWGRDDPENGIGSGPAEVTLGLRLRYEVRREFAPYVGVEWDGLLGDTADLARETGEAVRDTRVVAGLRIWF